MANSELLQLLLMEQAQSQAHIVFNEALAGLEKAAVGYTAVQCSGGVNTLSDAAKAYGALRLWGTPASAFSLLVGNVTRTFLISNATGKNAVVKATAASSVNVTVKPGTSAWIFVYDGAAYTLMAGYTSGSNVIGYETEHGVKTEMVSLVADVALTEGQYVDIPSLSIPHGGIVQCVNGRVIEGVSGATSFNVGVSGTPGLWATGVAVAVGTLWRGVTYSPIGFSYGPVPLRITSNDNPFAGGALRVALYYSLCAVPEG